MIELYFISNNGKTVLSNLKGVAEPTLSFLSNLKPIKENKIEDEDLNKKVGKGRYGIEKKYLLPFILIGMFCNICEDTVSFRKWNKGILDSNKSVLECMDCKTVKYI